MKIIPIKDLRDTTTISKKCHESDEPIFISKNGYEDLVIMSQELFDRNKPKSNKKSETKQKLNVKGEQSNTFGFVKVSASTVDIKVCDVEFNKESIKKELIKLNEQKVKVAVFQELGLTGYTCGDLFLHNKLLKEVKIAINDIVNFSKDYPILFTIGAPLEKDNKLYNCAVIIFKGQILAVVAKKNIPNYQEYYEDRHFDECPEENSIIEINGHTYPFGNKFIFVNNITLR